MQASAPGHEATQVWYGSIPSYFEEADVINELSAYGVRPYLVRLRYRDHGQDSLFCASEWFDCGHFVRGVSQFVLRVCWRRTPSRSPPSPASTWRTGPCARRSRGRTGLEPTSGSPCVVACLRHDIMFDTPLFSILSKYFVACTSLYRGEACLPEGVHASPPGRLRAQRRVAAAAGAAPADGAGFAAATAAAVSAGVAATAAAVSAGVAATAAAVSAGGHRGRGGACAPQADAEVQGTRGERSVV